MSDRAAEDTLIQRYGKTLPAGTVLFSQGESGDVMFVIQAGRVRISKAGPEGEKTLAIIGPGEFFGEMAILNRKPRSATAVVEEEAKLLVIDAKTFETMVVRKAEVGVRLIHKLASRLDAANALIDVLLHPDPENRVLLALVREAEFHGQTREQGGVLVNVSARELSELVGLEFGKVREVTEELVKQGLIVARHNSWLLPDPEQLRRRVSDRKAEGGR